METAKIVEVLQLSTMVPSSASDAVIRAEAESLAQSAKRFHENYIGLTPETPKCVDEFRILDCDGYKVRYLRAYNFEKGVFVCRLDLQLGLPAGKR